MEYSVSKEEQIELWDECWYDALEGDRDITVAIALAQAMFAYRVKFLDQGLPLKEAMGLSEDDK